jgi:hypothetical protein
LNVGITHNSVVSGGKSKKHLIPYKNNPSDPGKKIKVIKKKIKNILLYPVSPYSSQTQAQDSKRNHHKNKVVQQHCRKQSCYQYLMPE